MLPDNDSLERKNKAILAMTPEQIARFWSKVDKTPGQGPRGKCWGWTAGKLRGGYGQFAVMRKPFPAHRVAWTLERGPIPAGFLVCHDCDNPPCCNPECLFLGTNTDNMQDAARKGRTARGKRSGHYTHPERTARGERHNSRTHPERVVRGERYWSAKFTEADVLEIRAAAKEGVSYSEQGRRRGVNHTTIRRIVLRKSWKHVA